LLVSDNRQYEPYAIEAKDVLEIWLAKAYYSSQFPEAEMDNVTLSDQLALQIVKLQQELSLQKNNV
jgi:hypothetical protein